jgi:hypothetical protein
VVWAVIFSWKAASQRIGDSLLFQLSAK